MAYSSLQPGDGYDYYEQGVALYESGEYESAVVQLKNALKEDPRDLPSRILLGWSHLRVGDAAGAAKELQLARRLGADEDLVLVPLGNAYLLQRKHQQILAEIRSSDPASLGGSDVLVIRGQAYLQLGSLDEAEEMFSAALEESPQYVEGLLGLLRVELARSNLEAAQKLADRALDLAPGSAEPWFQSGELQRVQRNYDAALPAYNKALELSPGHLRAHNSRASVLLELGRHEDALADLDYTLARVPQDAQAAYLKAMAEARSGNREAARMAIEAASQNIMQLSPSRLQREPASLLLAGVIAQSAGSLDQARQYLRRYIKLRPTHVPSRKLLGRVLLDMGLASEAIEVLYPTLKLAPNDPDLLALTGSALLMQQNFLEAEKLFARAVEQLPGNTDVQAQLAVGQVGTGQGQLAITSLEELVAENPDQQRAAVLLTMLYARTGKTEEAKQTVEQLLHHSPQEPTYLNLRGSLQMSAGDYAAARADFETARDVAPDYVPAELNLAKISMNEGDYDDAVARFQHVLEDNPRETIALKSLARIAVARGDVHKAIALTEEIRAVGEGNVGVSVDLVALYIEAEEFQTARDLALRLVSDYPESAQAIEILARVEIAMENKGRAREALRRVARFTTLDVGELMRIAQLQVSIDDYTGAERTLERARTVAPESVAAVTSLVRLDLLLGRFDKALLRAEEVWTTRPGDTLGWILRGDVYHAMGEPLRALGPYEYALGMVPDSGVMVRQSNAWRDAGFLPASIWYLEQWMKLYPEDILVYRSMAAAYLQAGYLDSALLAHERLLRYYPEDVGVLNNLAWIYNEQGDERALKYARRAYELTPEDPVVLDTLGWVLVRSGDPRSAITYLRQAQSRAAKNPQIRYHLAVALSDLGRDAEARNTLQALLASSVDFPERIEAEKLFKSIGN